MKTKTRMIVASMTLAVAGLGGSTVHADLIAASSWNGGESNHHYSKAIGWQFKAKDDLLVTHLGVLDLDDAGLADSHTIGIFNMAGDLMVSTTVGSGLSGDYMADSMIYNSVGLTELKKNETYYILADNWSNDSYTFGNNAVSYSSDIEWLKFSESTSNSIFDSALHFDGQNGNLGPGFMYRNLPSPGALALLGLAGICSRRRRSC